MGVEQTQDVTANILEVRAEVVPDEDGDASWLEQTPAQLGSLEAAVWNRRRLAALHDGDWSFVGVRVVVVIELVNARGARTNSFELSSAGLWGIESDSGVEYFASVAKEEWEELVPELRALGFTDEDLKDEALDWDSRLVWK